MRDTLEVVRLASVGEARGRFGDERFGCFEILARALSMAYENAREK